MKKTHLRLLRWSWFTLAILGLLAASCGSSAQVISGDIAGGSTAPQAEVPGTDPVDDPTAVPAPAQAAVEEPTAEPEVVEPAAEEPAAIQADDDDEDAAEIGTIVGAGSVVQANAEVVPAVFDTVLEGEIEELFGSDAWLFEAEQGQFLTVDLVRLEGECRQDIDMLLIDPTGEEIVNEWVGNGGCNGHGPFELNITGEYALVFAGGDGAVIDRTTGEYAFIPSFLTD